MRALIYDGELHFSKNYSNPAPSHGQALVRVLKAGICRTDLEICKGYAGFKGVLGHEFVGIVEKSDDPSLLKKRVVGEINMGCGKCRRCLEGMQRHCSKRSALGIRDHDGCMADFCVLPNDNLIEIADDITDERAVFVEPLSAACEILEQTNLGGNEKAAVLGDGRLGILCAWTLSTVLSDVTIIGRQRKKLDLAKWRNVKTISHKFDIDWKAELVVEATGDPAGIRRAMEICAPRGTIVLKTILSQDCQINLSSLVVNEQTIVGSRCGRFEKALKLLLDYPDMPLERLVTKTYSLENSLNAFEAAKAPESLKILLEIGM